MKKKRSLPFLFPPMHWISKLLTGLVAVQHLYILWIEMFAWTTRGKKTFRSFPEHLFEPTKALAANQGLYNGFLAVGLFWSLVIQDAEWSRNIAIYFLGCVAVAGMYGGYSASRTIFFIQGIPALLALATMIIF
jgi:putative membrane protein